MTVIDRVRTTTTPVPPATAEKVPRRRNARRSLTPLAVGAGAFLLSFVGNWIPSLWYDETATVTSATRTWAQLWGEIQHVDAVHALYYSLMHVVFDVVGYSPLTLRLPSAIAVGVTAALVVVLVRKLASARVALLSGALFAIMPRVTWMGGEGRSYALTAMMAIILTLALLTATRSSRRRWWVAYGLLALVSMVLFAYLAFVIAAHVVTVGLRFAQHRVRRPDALAFAISVVGAVILISPFFGLIHSEKEQVAWLPTIDWQTIRQVYETQWFWGSVAWPLIAWVLLGIGAVRMVRARHTEFASFVLPVTFVPTILIVTASSLGEHLYSPRYLTMCTPFVAITMALGLAWFRRRWIPIAITVVLVGFGLVHQVSAQRIVEAKNQSSWSEVADGLAAHRAQLDDDGRAAIIYGPVLGHPAATSRVIEYGYPSAFANTTDVTLGTPASETGQLWETHRSIASSISRIQSDDVAYLVTSTKQDRRQSTLALLSSLGWHETNQWHYTGVNVVRYVSG